jgi:hypothetical protein
MAMSSSTASGPSCVRQLDRFASVRRLAHHLVRSHLGQQIAQALPRQRFVIGDQDAHGGPR